MSGIARLQVVGVLGEELEISQVVVGDVRRVPAPARTARTAAPDQRGRSKVSQIIVDCMFTDMYDYAYMRAAAELFKLFADSTRYRILHALAQGEFCVCELVDAVQAPQYTVSRHLAGLRKAGWVTERREGTWIYYRLAPERRNVIKDMIRVSAKHGLDGHALADDLKRLQSRLALRKGGRCVLGYGMAM